MQIINKCHFLSSFFLVFLLLSGKNAMAQNYYSQHAIGWHWYDDPKAEISLPPPPVKPADPVAQVDAIRHEVKVALDKVILDPTMANMKHYIALQEAVGNRAEKVADLWQQVILKNPQLNYGLKHPTNQVALQVKDEEDSLKKAQILSTFAKQTGLFFFYKSNCPYCKRFAPIVKDFAERNHITVIPITLDGRSLPEFPNSKIDTGQATQFQVKATPSLFAVNPYTKKAYPVAYGLTSEVEIRDMIYRIMVRQEEEVARGHQY